MKIICLLFLLLVVQFPAATQSISLMVIGNQKGVPAMLKQSELRSILMGERQRWRNGYKIKVALMRTNTIAGRSTCERLYNMSEDEANKFWLGQTFQGKGNVPKLFNTLEELMAYVAENPGAIGVVNQPPSTPGTQVVLIDGKRSL